MVRYQRICVHMSMCWICQVGDIRTENGDHGSSSPLPVQEFRVGTSWWWPQIPLRSYVILCGPMWSYVKFQMSRMSRMWSSMYREMSWNWI
jgi:hypothetical protein